jgi:hypothetical protein
MVEGFNDSPSAAIGSFAASAQIGANRTSALQSLIGEMQPRINSAHDPTGFS